MDVDIKILNKPTISIRLLVIFFLGPDKQAFRDKLLDGIHGLPLYIVTQPITCKIFVVLKNSSDMEKFLVDFTNSMIDDKNNCKIHVVGNFCMS